MRPKSDIVNLKSKILIIVGPTSSGKSELAVKLAKRFNGEIISCDSRQIYKGMDLGTGKVPGKWFPFSRHPERSEGSLKNKIFVYKSIPHHLIDFANPKRQYSAALFKRAAQKCILDITRRGKLPILCGGTGHWIDALMFDQNIPNVKPNFKLRAKLEKQSNADLFKQLKKLDPARAKNIDRFNKRRLIRALEIIIISGKPVPQTTSYQLPATSYNALWIGINQPQNILFAKIKKRLAARLKAGMPKEILRLRKQGISWKKLEGFGLEYTFVSLYLQKKISYKEMFDQLLLAIKHYSKRQMTWWKRNKNIIWISNPSDATKLAKQFPLK